MSELRRIAVISLHTCPWQQPGTGHAGGMNVYVRQTATEMAARGVAIDVFTRCHRNAPAPVTAPRPGLRLIHAPAGPIDTPKDALHAWLQPFVSTVLAFAEGDRCTYDAVLSHYWLSGVAAVDLAARWRVPHAAGFHTLSLLKQAAFPAEAVPSARIGGERHVIRHAHHLLATSSHERLALHDRYAVALNRISIASPGIDRERFRPRSQAESRRRLGLPEEGRLLLAVGRATPLKGLEVLLEALALIRTPEVSAVLVGGETGSAEQERLMSLARRIGVERRIRFAGSVPHDRLPAYYAASDVCVVPSFYESFGLVALEAIASGRPVVASRVGGLRGIVRDGVDGLLVSPGSATEIAAAIDVLLYRSLGGSASEPHVPTWSATTDAVFAALARAAEDLHGPVDVAIAPADVGAPVRAER